MPAAFQNLYTQEMNYLTSFNATLSQYGTGAAYPVLRAGTLSRANSNAGPQLLNAAYMAGLQLQLQELKALGVQAIEVEVGFPMLYEPFLTSQGQSPADYVSFYQQVAAMVRAQGLKLIVENNNLLANDIQAGWDSTPFYSTLDWTAYQQARAETAVTIVQTMQPDYLVVLEEPDTEAMNSGQSEANTPDGAIAMLGQILAGLQTYRQTGLKVGAGLGTWLYGFQNYIQGFVAQPMDFIDMHIYPINNSFLPNALTIASMAASAGMPVAMTECWLNKQLDSELNVLTVDQVRARNPFSFWDPLDQYYLETIETLANNTQMLFVAPSNSEYFFAYATYDDSTANLTPSEIIAQSQSLASQANQNAAYTSAGMSYYSSNVIPPDKTPPAVPTGLTGGSGNPTTAYLTWNAAADNVGVAGYYVLRDGVIVGTTGQSSFQDSGLAEAQTYSYTVQAFDLGGNVSPSSQAVSVTADDVTPPSPPGNLAATPVSCERVTLTWTPSADNQAINSYTVYWGLSPAALTQAGRTYGTSSSFSSYPLTANTTYYYAVQATDKSQNTSVLSAIVTITTPAPPAAPANLAVTPLSTTKTSLSWSASVSGGLPVNYYHIFRGTSASNLNEIFVTSKTSYTDTTVAAATKYYYGVQASDTGADLSPMSGIVSVNVPAAPSAPANLVVTPASATKISLSWSASVSGGLPIQYYHVYRGSSTANLSEIGVTSKASYIDTSVTASARYYYGVQAADTGKDLSPMSAAVSVTVPSLPSAPAGLVATPTSATKVSLSWSASVSGGLPIQYYYVYRGTTSSNLGQLATTAKTSYIDTKVTAGTTYYYAVQAADTGKDLSPMSAIVAAAVPRPPSAPASLVATPLSTKKISLAWSASVSGGLPVQY